MAWLLPGNSQAELKGQQCGYQRQRGSWLIRDARNQVLQHNTIEDCWELDEILGTCSVKLRASSLVFCSTPPSYPPLQAGHPQVSPGAVKISHGYLFFERERTVCIYAMHAAAVPTLARRKVFCYHSCPISIIWPLFQQKRSRLAIWIITRVHVASHDDSCTRATAHSHTYALAQIRPIYEEGI